MDDKTNNNYKKIAALIGVILFNLFSLSTLTVWIVFFALSGMGFDSGFSWGAAAISIILLLYPIFILYCLVKSILKYKKTKYLHSIIFAITPWVLFNIIFIFAKKATLNIKAGAGKQSKVIKMSPFDQKGYVKNRARHNGCLKIADFKIREIDADTKIYEVTCKSKKIIFECNFNTNRKCYLKQKVSFIE